MSEHDVIAEKPPAIKLLAGMVSKVTVCESIGLQHIVSMRVPFHIVARFDAMSEYSGQSRSKLMVSALESAIEQLSVMLSPDDLSALDKIEARIVAKRLNGQDDDVNQADLVSGGV